MGRWIGSVFFAGCFVSSFCSQVAAQTCSDAARCFTSSADFSHREALFADVMLDSGWVPASAPLQLRVAVLIGGSTEVDMETAPIAYWPEPVSFALSAAPNSGRLAINYGIELIAQVRIDTTIAGTRYMWMGDIPTGSIPRDLRMADEETFTPFAFGEGQSPAAVVMDSTEVIRAFEYDITDSIIPIPGVGGGVAIDVAGMLTTTYKTTFVDLGEAIEPIRMDPAIAILSPFHEGDFGANVLVDITPHGNLAYDGGVTLWPTLFVELPGRRLDYPIAEIPLSLVSTDTDFAFDSVLVDIPLPDVRIDDTRVEFGEVELDAEAEESIRIYNDGLAELRVGVRSLPADFSAPTSWLVIAPGGGADLPIRFRPSERGERYGMWVLTTNDPDESMIAIDVAGYTKGFIPAAPDGGPGEEEKGYEPSGATSDGGCACQSGPQARRFTWLHGFASFAAFFVLMSRHRMRANRTSS